MSIQFSKTVIEKGATALQNFLKKNKREPNTLKIKSMDGKERTLTKKQYKGLYKNNSTFYNAHGRLANYVTLLYESTLQAAFRKQPDGYSCGPTSLVNAAALLYKYIPVQTMIKYCKCSKASGGTTAQRLIDGGKKAGLKVTIIKRTESEVKKVLATGCPVIMQYWTKSAPCSGFQNGYGHYCLCYGISNGYYLIYDPTKGPIKCKFSVMNKATGGSSNRHFYSVELL